MTKRMQWAALASAVALLAAAGAAAQTADDFPNRPIRIIVPQAAGSGVDLQARVLAQKMGELWGQQGIVENRPGANAIVGMEAAAKAQPDGYTLIYAPVSCRMTRFAISPRLPRPLPIRWARWSIPLPGSIRSRTSSNGPKRAPVSSTMARSASVI